MLSTFLLLPRSNVKSHPVTAEPTKSNRQLARQIEIPRLVANRFYYALTLMGWHCSMNISLNKASITGPRVTSRDGGTWNSLIHRDS